MFFIDMEAIVLADSSKEMDTAFLLIYPWIQGNLFHLVVRTLCTDVVDDVHSDLRQSHGLSHLFYVWRFLAPHACKGHST